MQTYRVCGVDIPVVKRRHITSAEIVDAPFIVFIKLGYYYVYKARHTQLAERLWTEEELESLVKLYLDLGYSGTTFRFMIQ